ncbi:TPA: two-component sensor histidine kinase, partial [Enterococcus faecium]
MVKKSFKPFGEWAIKLTQDSKRATEKRRRINLTSKEISELL